MDLDFYFNEWTFLAKADPALFEQRRREYINAFVIRSGARRVRLEALQLKIDRLREQAATPERAVVAISELMCASLSELAGETTKLLKEMKRLKSDQLRHAAASVQQTALRHLAA